MGEIKSERILDIFFRSLKGESISVKKLADEFHTSTRSISRDITCINNYMSDHNDTVGFASLVYNSKNKTYDLQMDEFISGKELLSLTKAMIATRALNTEDMVEIIGKLKSHATPKDKKKLELLINKELYNYEPVKSDCPSVLDNIWEISDYIEAKQYITITYTKMDRSQVKHKIIPLSMIFSEYYYYLIACECDDKTISIPKYFRIDRITQITAHREHFTLDHSKEFDESLLRKRSQFMWPGELRRIRFEFNGPSIQAILDKIPTAKIIEKKNGTYLVEAEVYGDGIKMFLLSQGSWVKVISPPKFVEEMREEINKMQSLY